MKCPGCGKDSTGRFCSHCGTPLHSGTCAGCGTRLAAGTRFCTQCGTRVGDGAPRTRAATDNLGWYVAAGVLLVLVLVVGLPMAFRDRPAPAPAGIPLSGAPAATGNGEPGLLTGTPREQADRLFNRIMTAREADDTAQVNLFLPMALQAYRAIELDYDGLYHLSMLEAASGDLQAAMTTAGRILAPYPDHLLALAATAQAAGRQGDSATARKHWQRFLDVYDKEKGKTLQEYLDHARIMPEYEAEARQFLGR